MKSTTTCFVLTDEERTICKAMYDQQVHSSFGMISKSAARTSLQRAGIIESYRCRNRGGTYAWRWRFTNLGRSLWEEGQLR